MTSSKPFSILILLDLCDLAGLAGGQTSPRAVWEDKVYVILVCTSPGYSQHNLWLCLKPAHHTQGHEQLTWELAEAVGSIFRIPQ